MAKQSRGKSLFALAGAFALLWSCGDEPTGGTAAPTKDDIIGKWTLTTAVTSTTTVYHLGGNIPDSTEKTDTVKTFTGNNDFAEFRSDMTYTVRADEILPATLTGTGTWAISGSLLRLISTGNDTTDVTAGVSGKNGSFTKIIADTAGILGLTITTNGYMIVSAAKQ